MRAGRAMLREAVCSIKFPLRVPPLGFLRFNPERIFSYPIIVPGEPGQKDVK